jgi:hypothetical protein
MSEQAFWIDDEYDRDRASNGVSRYDSYIRQHIHEFQFGEDDDADFAVLAWRVATGPIMAPGYVQQHPRVISSKLMRNYDGDGLIASISLVAELPYRASLSRTGMSWGTWPQQHGHYYRPEGDDLASGGYLLATTEALFALPISLPPAPDHRDDYPGTAAREVMRRVVEALNPIVTPLIEYLEAER